MAPYLGAVVNTGIVCICKIAMQEQDHQNKLLLPLRVSRKQFKKESIAE
jgi:hypothetical protein